MSIHINQLAYPLTGAKQALIVPAAARYTLVRADTGDIVLEKACEPSRRSPSAWEDAALADFSECGAGQYILLANGERSAPITIAEQPYEALKEALLRVFDLHRCGEALDAPPWSHTPCHTESAELYGTERTVDVHGGWHDAGDYGRYVVPAAKALADLYWAYLLSSAPNEALLPLARYELDWLLRMQDTDGGLFHKVTCPHFCGMVQPDQEKERLVLCPISAAATGDGAAIFALASRIYKGKDDAFAARLLEAARRAYAWLKAHPDMPGFVNPPGILTGEYGDGCDTDERYWAACELYAATGDQDCLADAAKLGVQTGLGWGDVGDYGSMALLFAAGNQDHPLTQAAKAALTNKAEALMALYAKEPYTVALERFPWGSNMDAANNAVLLLLANRLQPNKSWQEAAAGHIHYLLGRNAVGVCHVSGFGHNPMQRPHHRPNHAAGQCMPGMLSGGPAQDLQDEYAKRMLTGCAPQKCYVDDMRSYSTNEMTIYWNSPLYLALTLLDD